MATKTRPRWDEFVLALFWTLAGAVLLYFGITGYCINLGLLDDLETSLPRFIISFGLICLAVFGVSYAFRIFARVPARLRLPGWTENGGALALGSLLLAGFGFSLFTLGVLIYGLFANGHSRFVLAWGVVTVACLVVLAIYQLLWSLNLFEPFLPWPDEFYNQQSTNKANLPLRLLLNLNSVQHSLLNRTGKFGQALATVSGPLLLEPDPKTTVAPEKAEGRPGLEKSLIAHGGWHANTLGFLANGTLIFAVSDGGTVHYQAGGRKGLLFPPEIKLWDVHSDKVQMATLGQPYTFLTRKYQTPAPIQNYRFIVPTGGGKFALVTPNFIRVGDWQSNTTFDHTPATPLVLRGFGGFTPLAFNSEGSKIAWCSADDQTYFWNLEDEQPQTLRLYPVKEQAQTGEAGGVWGLVFSPDGTKVATLGAQGVLLQNIYTGWRWFAQNDPAHERLTAFAFNFNGFQMAVGLTLPVELVRLPSLRRSRATLNQNERVIPETKLPNHPQPAVAQTADQKWANIVRLWDLRQPDYLDLLAGDEPLREIMFSPDNQMVAAVDEGGVLRLWDIAPEGLGGRSPRLAAQLDVGMSGRKTVLAFSPDVQRLVCATDNRLLIFSLDRLRREAAI